MAVPASGHWQSTAVGCESWNQGHGDQNSCLCFRSAEKSRYPKITLAAECQVANDREHGGQRGTWVLSWKRQESRRVGENWPIISPPMSVEKSIMRAST